MQEITDVINPDTLRLITSSFNSPQGPLMSYEIEGRDSKIYIFQKNAIGFAGSVPNILELRGKIQPKDDVEEFAKYITTLFQSIKDVDMDKIIKQLTMRDTRADFIKEQGTIPAKLVELVYSKYATYKTDCQALIAGFDSHQNARIFGMLDAETFSIEDLTEMHHYSIGSGHPFSMIFYDQQDYNCNCNLQEGLYFAYRAKKNAEAHTGVGEPTDIIILRKDSPPKKVLANDPLIMKLDDAYKEEKANITQIRSKIFSDITSLL
jgi:hypothetical protein